MLDKFIEEIEEYCHRMQMAKSTFGLKVVNDGKLISRLKDGKGITLANVNKIQEYMLNNPPQGGMKNKIQTRDFSVANSRKTKSSPPKKSSADSLNSPQQTPFRFYDNRQKYLSFINTCNEKPAIAKRAGKEFQYIHPTPPAFRLFDAGMGDATVLSDCLRDLHHRFPTVPFVIVAKEISMEDVRISLDKIIDRFCEHPATILVLTNLHYAEAPKLMPKDVASANAMNWQEIKLQGNNSHGYKDQLESLHGVLAEGWATQTSKVTGNPLFKRPSVVVMYREDHQILLDAVIPKPGLQNWQYDFIMASQPWRAKTSARFKAEKIIAPLVRTLAPGGRMLTVQSCGNDPAQEIIQQIWPDEQPFPISRHDVLKELKKILGRETRNYNIKEMSDSKSIFKYKMHTLPSEIGGGSIGTSTLFAAWNAAIYVCQIEEERLEEVMENSAYLQATAKILNKYGGLWFNDESFVVSRAKA